MISKTKTNIKIKNKLFIVGVGIALTGGIVAFAIYFGNFKSSAPLVFNDCPISGSFIYPENPLPEFIGVHPLLGDEEHWIEFDFSSPPLGVEIGDHLKVTYNDKDKSISSEEGLIVYDSFNEEYVAYVYFPNVIHSFMLEDYTFDYFVKRTCPEGQIESHTAEFYVSSYNPDLLYVRWFPHMWPFPEQIQGDKKILIQFNDGSDNFQKTCKSIDLGDMIECTIQFPEGTLNDDLKYSRNIFYRISI